MLKTKVKLVALLAIVAFSCKEVSKEPFLDTFKEDLKSQNASQVVAYTVFPLVNGEYLLDEIVTEEVFVKRFNDVFDAETIELFDKVNVEDIEELSNKSLAEGYEKPFQIKLSFVTEDTETAIYYVFAVDEGVIKLVAIDMAG